MVRKIFVEINNEEREVKSLNPSELLPLSKELNTDARRLSKVLESALDSFEEDQEEKEMHEYGAEHIIVRGHGYYEEAE